MELLIGAYLFMLILSLTVFAIALGSIGLRALPFIDRNCDCDYACACKVKSKRGEP